MNAHTSGSRHRAARLAAVQSPLGVGAVKSAISTRPQQIATSHARVATPTDSPATKRESITFHTSADRLSSTTSELAVSAREQKAPHCPSAYVRIPTHHIQRMG